jgi:signal peptidase I
LSAHRRAPRRRVTAALGGLWMVVSWAVLSFLVGLVLLTTDGQLHKYQFMAVLSGSMVPTMHVGDLVVAEVVPPSMLASGDLATFREPTTHRLITHRVQSILWHGELADVITRGDANQTGENWTVRADDKVGRVVLRVPHAGYALAALGTPAGQLGLAGLAALLGGWVLVTIWRPGAAEEEEPVPGTPTGPVGHRAPSPRRGPRLSVGVH